MNANHRGLKTVCLSRVFQIHDTRANQALTSTSSGKLVEPVTMFGESFTGQSAWILAVTHLHEHLGQMIAYARTNGVKPPWS